MSRLITKTVWLLSLVSLFNDMASEMLYPVIPLYLQHIGLTALTIGILEGIAEAATGLSKIWFGHWSDMAHKRLPFVRLGYLLSVLSKPLFILFQHPAWITGSRALDRLGKGLRTGARDAILSNEANQHNKGAVFGLHRGMDSLGAAVGPALALLWLFYNPENYQALFYIAVIPGALAILLTLVLKEPHWKSDHKKGKPKLAVVFQYWKKAAPGYKKLVLALFCFALFNSSDMFLLLWLKEKGYSDLYVIGMYIFFNLVYALAAFPLGRLGDKIGLKKILLFGMLIYTAVYGGFVGGEYLGLPIDMAWWMGICFALYGLFWASTEGVAKAMISQYCQQEDAATGLGFFAGWNSIINLVASVLAGWTWFYFGATWMMVFTAAGALISFVVLWMIPTKTNH